MVAECVRTGNPVGAAMASNLLFEPIEQENTAKGSLSPLKIASIVEMNTFLPANSNFLLSAYTMCGEKTV